MNERIKEFILASGLYESSDEDALRFAEMIIEECLQTIKDNIPEDSEDDLDFDFGYKQGMRDCLHHISEHFGIPDGNGSNS